MSVGSRNRINQKRRPLVGNSAMKCILLVTTIWFIKAFIAAKNSRVDEAKAWTRKYVF